MKGLILKDLLVIRHIMKKGMILLYLALLAFIAYQGKAMAGGAAASFMMMLAVTSASTSLNLDDATGWRRTERLLPLTIRQRVGAKYLLLIVILLALSPVIIAIGLILPLIFPGTSAAHTPMMLGILWGVSLVYNAVALPLAYQFRSRARMVLMLLMILLATWLMGLFQSGGSAALPARMPFSPRLFTWLALLLPPALYGLSYLLSVKLYRKALDD